MPKSSSRQNHTETNICLWSSCTIDNISEFLFFLINHQTFFFALLKFYFVLYTDSNKNTAQLAQGVHGKLSLLASDPAHNTKKEKKRKKKIRKGSAAWYCASSICFASLKSRKPKFPSRSVCLSLSLTNCPLCLYKKIQSLFFFFC